MITTWYAPNGLEITGTLEALTGRARISGISEDGTPEHAGGTEVFLEDGKTVERNGKPVFLDEEGGEWTFDQLTSEPPEDEDDTVVDDEADDDEDGDTVVFDEAEDE